ncbi:hypothetical protein K461DRAFT_264409 [Myriangium duriaei CBS 260.36]|uniref:Ubiquitin-like domain-containing protein n=1 Tax=Myriangium duriaei CBS 260.36 TaxID=1168546 RepID=A0A9P4JCE0_9PEZI|nr:hypothetical protein K461DRAFT_264409 [Myriangium duriaei CBS 260.36]
MDRRSDGHPPRSSFSDHSRPLYRHVRAPTDFDERDEHAISTSSSSSPSSGDFIGPDESASAPRGDHHSQISLRPPPGDRSRAPSHASRPRPHHLHIPQGHRPNSHQGSFRAASRERVRIRETIVDPPYHRSGNDTRRHTSGSRERSRERSSSSGSSMSGSDSTSSYGEPGPRSRGFHYDHHQYPHHTPYPQHHGPPPGPHHGPPPQAYSHYELTRMPPPMDHYDRYGRRDYYGEYPPDFPPDYRRQPPPRPLNYPETRPYQAPDLMPAAYYANHHHYPPPPQPQIPMQPVAYISTPSPAPKSPAPPPENPELKALEARYKELLDAQTRAEEHRKLAEMNAAREEKIRIEAEIKAIEKYQAAQAEDKRRKDEIAAAENAAKEKSEKAADEKAKKVKEETEKKAAEEKKKFDEMEKKKKELEEEVKKVKGDPDEKKPPIRMKDAVLDRRFDFPWKMGKNWNSTMKLLEQAFEAFPDLHARILENRFELAGPDKQIILPSVWETTVQPGWEVSILMANEDPMVGLPHGVGGMTLDDHGHKHGKKKKKSSSKSKHKEKRREFDIVDPMPHFHGGGVPLPPGALPFPPPPGAILPDLEEDERHRKKKKHKEKKMFIFGGTGKRRS